MTVTLDLFLINHGVDSFCMIGTRVMDPFHPAGQLNNKGALYWNVFVTGTRRPYLPGEAVLIHSHGGIDSLIVSGQFLLSVVSALFNGLWK